MPSDLDLSQIEVSGEIARCCWASVLSGAARACGEARLLHSGARACPGTHFDAGEGSVACPDGLRAVERAARSSLKDLVLRACSLLARERLLVSGRWDASSNRGLGVPGQLMKSSRAEWVAPGTAGPR